jgi:hypothetical protein
MAPHGVNIADGVGCRDLSENIGIVYRRRDKVGSHDDGQVIAQTIDPGIVVGFIAYQQVGIIGLGKPRQQRTEPDRVDFSGSSAGFGKVLEGGFLKEFYTSHLYCLFNFSTAG